MTSILILTHSTLPQLHVQHYRHTGTQGHMHTCTHAHIHAHMHTCTHAHSYHSLFAMLHELSAVEDGLGYLWYVLELEHSLEVGESAKTGLSPEAYMGRWLDWATHSWTLTRLFMYMYATLLRVLGYGPASRTHVCYPLEGVGVRSSQQDTCMLPS